MQYAFGSVPSSMCELSCTCRWKCILLSRALLQKKDGFSQLVLSDYESETHALKLQLVIGGG